MSDKLDPREHAAIRKKIFESVLGEKKGDGSQPRLILLGGQPGAGKGGLRNDIKLRLKAPIEIDIDELRIFHPRYRDFVKENPSTAASRVQEDCSQWAAELFDEAVKLRLNVIYDGTLSVTSKATDMAKEAAKSGFAVEVHVVATSLDVSQQGVNGRFEEAYALWENNKKNATPPRTVPSRIQKSAYDNIPGTLKALCETGVVSRMRVGNRSGDPVCDLVGKAAVKRDGPNRAIESLEAERNRPWTKTEIEEYADRGDKITHAMERRGVSKEDIAKLEETQASVVERRGKELQAAQGKQDEWIARLVHYKISDLQALAPPPKAKKKNSQVSDDIAILEIDDSVDEQDLKKKREKGKEVEEIN